MLQIVVEKLEFETIREALHGPRLGIWLIAAHDQTADLFLPIGEAVGIAQRRQIPRHALDCLGNEILVLYRCERNVDPCQAPELARPLAGTDRELAASDPSFVG